MRDDPRYSPDWRDAQVIYCNMPTDGPLYLRDVIGWSRHGSDGFVYLLYRGPERPIAEMHEAEVDLDQLLIALGWHLGMAVEENEHALRRLTEELPAAGRA